MALIGYARVSTRGAAGVRPPGGRPEGGRRGQRRPAQVAGTTRSGILGPVVDVALWAGRGSGPRHSRWERADRMRSFRRSEEHTSELQSRQYLVCRLLLEKKKQIPSTHLTQ